MKKFILSLLVFSVSICLFSQTEDNAAYNPNKTQVVVKQSVIDSVQLKTVTPQSSADSVKFQSNYKYYPTQTQQSSADFYEQERAKQMRHIRNLYNYNGNFVVDRVLRYGSDVLLHSMTPF